MKNCFLLLLLTFTSTLYAGDKKGIDVTVNLSPVGSFHVESSKIKGKVIKDKNGVFRAKKIYIKIKSLKTGIDLRDDHMKKRLSAKKHPKILVTGVKAKGGKGKAKISIKGIKKPFKFTYDVDGKLMKTKFQLNLKKFKIKDLKYAGVGAKDIVQIKANIPIK